MIVQEGLSRLWRGTNASLALAIPTAFKETQAGVRPPGVWKTLLGVVSPVRSAITFKIIRRRILSLIGDEVNAVSILGANLSAGFVAGTLAVATTCRLDDARTRRQIEQDRARQIRMTTRQTLVEIWRDGGWRGLFTGVGPRVMCAGPSVGIVVSSYEVLKYALYHRHLTD